jgi:hypothetical protein
MRRTLSSFTTACRQQQQQHPKQRQLGSIGIASKKRLKPLSERVMKNNTPSENGAKTDQSKLEPAVEEKNLNVF